MNIKLHNQKWVLASYPKGMPVRDNWRLEHEEIPEPNEQQILTRALYLSVDPYMRGRISPKQGYAKGVKIGELMTGGAVAEVIQSKHPDWKTGDLCETINYGWQQFAVLDPQCVTRVNPELGPPHAWLSFLGMPGITAWCALHEIGQPKSGDTVLISAASGAVGQVAGQIAKAMGCRTVAIASSKDKIDWCLKIGYDVAINYRESDDLVRDFSEACPNGIDVFFDNTAGAIHDAAMQNLALNARVIIVGTIALAGQLEEPDYGERFLRQILVSRAKIQGFLVFDHLNKYDEARHSLANMYAEDQLKFKTDFINEFELMPDAFLNLLHSRNIGKQLVRTPFSENFLE